MKCCNGSCLKPAQPMCDGRPFASPLFRRLAGRGALFWCFPFRWVLHILLFLTRCLAVQDAASCSRDSLYECGRPCDSMSCLFFTALWLTWRQSILVQEIVSEGYQSDLLQDVPNQGSHIVTSGAHMSLDWQVDPMARFDQYRPSSHPDDPNDEQQRGSSSFHTLPLEAGMLFNHLKFCKVLLFCIHVAI